MSWIVQPKQTPDNPHWRFAEYISMRLPFPEQALQKVFQLAMQELRQNTEPPISPDLQKKVWRGISEKRLSKLKDFMTKTLYRDILNFLEEKEVEEILKEVEAKKEICNNYPTIEKFLKENLHIVHNKVTSKAKNMYHDWMPEIVLCLKGNGIQIQNKFYLFEMDL
jgi:hypothetical protein